MEAIKKDKKTGILYRNWIADRPEAIFLLVHGLGAHSGRWEKLSDFFLQRSFSSYAIELKGFGKNEGPNGYVDSFKTYLRDIHTLHNIVITENKGKKVFLLGESMGALISFLVAALDPRLFDGLICISPAFTNLLKVSILEYIKIFSSLTYNPRKVFHLPFTSGMCTRDLDYQKAMEEDPMEHNAASGKLIFELLMSQIKSRLLKNKIKVPVLFLVAGDDKLVDPEASKKLFKSMKIENKTLIEYPGMYHALSVELEKERVFEDILKWLKKIN